MSRVQLKASGHCHWNGPISVVAAKAAKADHTSVVSAESSRAQNRTRI
jgi:hypothetical protein